MAGSTSKGVINALLHLAEKLEVITQFGSNGKGAYAAGTQYQKGDLVSYNSLAYIAITATIGNLPTNTTYWQQITVAGATGAMGPAGAQGAKGAAGVVQAVVAGANITVDNTDPANPIIASTGGGSGDFLVTQVFS